MNITLDGNAAFVIIVAVVAIAWNARWAIEALAARRHPAPQAADLDELADRIEQAITSATSDLREQLKRIEDNTAAWRHAEAVANLRRPRAWTTERDEATDLTKPDPSQSGYQPTDLR